jgi:hypothetical protein
VNTKGGHLGPVDEAEGDGGQGSIWQLGGGPGHPGAPVEDVVEEHCREKVGGRCL